MIMMVMISDGLGNVSTKVIELGTLGAVFEGGILSF